MMIETSVRQIPRIKFLHGCPVAAELVDRRARWRERELIKRTGKHSLQVILIGNTNSDVRIVMCACAFRNKCRDIVDQGGLDVGIPRRGRERGRSACVHSERRNRLNQCLL